MNKIDLRKELKYLYAPSVRKVEVAEVPEFSFAMIDGTIGPGETPETSQEFRDALGALYGVTYTLKFMSRLRTSDPVDYTVMPLEGLWWTDSGEFDFNRIKEEWRWTMIILQPEHITEEMVQEALQQLKKKRENPVLPRLRFERFREGLCIQVMHVGPYAEEPQTIGRMKAFAQESGYVYRGKHHEIYMGDPRRARPERLRTILRQPVEKIA